MKLFSGLGLQSTLTTAEAELKTGLDPGTILYPPPKEVRWGPESPVNEMFHLEAFWKLGSHATWGESLLS